MTKSFEYGPDNNSYFTKHRGPNPRTPKKCAECGKLFTPEYWSEVACSDTCKNARYLHRTSKPTKTNGSFTNTNSFDKAWEEAKKQWSWHDDNVKANEWKETL